MAKELKAAGRARVNAELWAHRDKATDGDRTWLAMLVTHTHLTPPECSALKRALETLPFEEALETLADTVGADALQVRPRAGRSVTRAGRNLSQPLAPRAPPRGPVW